jgi:hypothetical protein
LDSTRVFLYHNPARNHTKFEGLLSICNAELYKRLSFFIRKATAKNSVYAIPRKEKRQRTEIEAQ